MRRAGRGTAVLAGVMVLLVGFDPRSMQAAVALAQTTAEQVGLLESRDQNWAQTPKQVVDATAASALNADPVPVPDPTVLPEPQATFPAGGSAVISVAAAAAPAALSLTAMPTDASSDGGTTGDPVSVGGLDMSVAAVPGQPAPQQVQVDVLDQAGAISRGVSGVVLDLSAISSGQSAPAAGTATSGAVINTAALRTDAAPAASSSVQISVSYAGFEQAFGGGYASRLTLVQIPACAATTPEAPECAAVPVASSVNDTTAKTVTATVQIPSSTSTDAGAQLTSRVVASTPTVLDAADTTPPASASYALKALTSGSAGDWGATTLPASTSWSASGGTGEFAWSYPITVPSPPAGPTPPLALSYSSASLDSRTPGSNPQSSWVGDGWDLPTGFVERSYTPCATDLDPVDGVAPNNVGHPTGDLCWGNDNARVVLAGHSFDAVRDGSTWRVLDDDGTRLEHLTGAANGDDDGEYWVVTTTDGLAYTFGKQTAWTVPVYGNHPGEPGYQPDFAASSLVQGWRWALETVTDPSGNTIHYQYQTETNHYSANGGAGGTRQYVRGGYPTEIDYGARGDDPSPYRIEFVTADRCIPADGHVCGSVDPANPHAAAWFDTPVDLQCDQGACSNVTSPVFFTNRRLTTIKTESRSGSAWVALDTYQLAQEFRSTQDSGSAVLWLHSITRTGMRGIPAGQPGVSLGAVWFEGDKPWQGRVRTSTDGAPGRGPLNRYRVQHIHTETGADIAITYGTPDGAACTPTSPTPPANLAAAQRDSGMACFPVEWYDLGQPVFEYMKKYVVLSVTADGAPRQADGETLATGSVPVVTEYAYQGAPAWTVPDGATVRPGTALASDWRGFDTVVTTTGQGSEQQAVTTRYYRGLGTALSAGPGGQVHVTDNERLRGQELSTSVSNGTVPVSVTVNAPSVTVEKSIALPRIGNDASHSVTVSRIGQVAAHTFTFDATGAVAAHTQVTQTLDEFAQPTRINDAGDVATTDDDQCTDITYADTTQPALAALNLRTAVASTTTTSKPCPSGQVTPETVVPDDLVTATRATFDDLGRPVTTEQIDPKDGVGFVQQSTATYDAYGRVTSTSDAAGQVTTTSYSMSAAGQTVAVATTTPDVDGPGPLGGFTTTTTFDPVTGLQTQSTDVNQKVTKLEWDALGRLSRVWLPQHAATGNASLTYDYVTQANGLSGTITHTLVSAGSKGGKDTGTRYQDSAVYYDGLGRTFQSQTESADVNDPGRMVSQTFYDTAGRVRTTWSPWKATGRPGSGPVDGDQQPPKSATVTVYDGAGRPSASQLITNTEQPPLWQTTTSYDGLRTLTIPPTGATPTETIVDARGRTTTLRQYLRDDAHAAADTPAEVRALPSQSTTYSYTPAGALATMAGPVTDPATATATTAWSYTYDWAGRRIEAHDPDAGTTQTFYDPLGRVDHTVDADGNTTRYTYDALGRATSRTDAAGNLEASWTYDSTPGPDGKPVLGAPSSSTSWSAGNPYTMKIDAYDVAGRATSTTLTLPNLPALTALGNTAADGTHAFTTTTGYTLDGAVSATNLPAVTTAAGAKVLGAETVRTEYDSAGMPTWQTGWFGWGVYVAQSLHDAYGRLTAADLGNTYGTVATWNYDPVTDRLTGIALDREGINGTDLDLHYGYDDAGNVTYLADQPTTAGYRDTAGNQVPAKADNQCFTYDGLRRLTQAYTAYTFSQIDQLEPGRAPTGCVEKPATGQVGGAAPYWTTYDKYDLDGNRTTTTSHALGGTGTDTVTNASYGADAAGPHAITSSTTTVGSTVTQTASYTYDEAGNQTSRTLPDGTTQQLGWDQSGRLNTVTTTGAPTGTANGTESIVYDADGNRLTRTDAAGTTIYLPAGQEVTVSTGGAVLATRYYTFGGITVAVRTGQGMGAVTSLIPDAHGTTIAAIPNTDYAAGAVRRIYTDPFGLPRGATGDGTGTGTDPVPGDKDFLGKTKDTTGLVAVGARYYDPITGTFISVDPLLDLTDPTQWNAYAYADNNPLTFSDPNGTRPLGSGDYGYDPRTNPTGIAPPTPVGQYAGVSAATGRSSSSSVSALTQRVGTAAHNATAATVNAIASFGNAMLQNPSATLSVLGGLSTMLGGMLLATAGGVVCFTGIGCLATPEAVALGGAIALTGAATAGAGISTLIGQSAGDSRVEVMQRSAGTEGDAGEADGYDLSAAEKAGGHTIERHVGMSDQALIDRNIPYASTFTNKAAAEQVTGQNIASNADAISEWLAGTKPRLPIQDSMDPALGRVYARATNSFIQPSGVNTVLVRTPSGYNVLTSYPTP